MNCKCKTCKCGKSMTDEIIQQMDDLTKPFTDEIINDNERIRHFDPLAPHHLFKWHWDEEDRWIESLDKNDWQFQFDNELPQPIEPGKIIYIPTGLIHRIIKGTTPISVRIKH